MCISQSLYQGACWNLPCCCCHCCCFFFLGLEEAIDGTLALFPAQYIHTIIIAYIILSWMWNNLVYGYSHWQPSEPTLTRNCGGLSLQWPPPSRSKSLLVEWKVGRTDLPTYDHSFAGLTGSAILHDFASFSRTPLPHPTHKRIRWWLCMRNQCNERCNEQNKLLPFHRFHSSFHLLILLPFLTLEQRGHCHTQRLSPWVRGV